MAEQSDGVKKPVIIKKYANRRLYNTSTSTYVTLDHLSQMVKEGTEFEVFDAKSGEDITRQVLTHIIVEEESKGGPTLLPIGFLRHLISFYGDSLQSVVPNYLEHTMQSFAQNQDQMRSYMDEALGGLSPFGQLEDVGKKNMAMFENAMKMFAPFYQGVPGQTHKPNAGSAPAPAAPAKDAEAEKLDELRAKLDAMQKQLDGLSGDS
ncbi:MAG: polyhydroxyalkanoate synthesis repressor PhaR [Rhodospirillales bacterium]|nr:polyhydroxyalkanoate synthesis repressor PhaR [Rhodospirillales bacterium]